LKTHEGFVLALKTEILMKGLLMFEICDFGKSKLAAKE
jgi:hypothetical protein